MSFRAWLDRACGAPGREGDAVRRVVHALDAMEPERAQFVALWAFLLARVANVDLDVGPEETREMERLVECAGELPAAQATVVVELAKVQNRLLGEAKDCAAARELATLASAEQKRDLLHCLFAVASADGGIDVPEEDTIREIARELRVGCDEYLAIRCAYGERRRSSRS
jgi:uncharacterized tellurite resistance protein B-like protein